MQGRKQGTTESVSLARTFEEPTTSKPLMQTRLQGEWSGKRPAEETAEARGTPAMLAPSVYELMEDHRADPLQGNSCYSHIDPNG